MTVSILGEHISVVRPSPPHRCIVYSNERPRARNATRTSKAKCNKVKLVCVQELGGVIYSLTKGTHLDVLQTFKIDPARVIKTGWQLDDNQFIWR